MISQTPPVGLSHNRKIPAPAEIHAKETLNRLFLASTKSSSPKPTKDLFEIPIDPTIANDPTSEPIDSTTIHLKPLAILNPTPLIKCIQCDKTLDGPVELECAASRYYAFDSLIR
ncbi:hypothetical protein ACJZ2D_017032 [Fusarium nematophilum]